MGNSSSTAEKQVIVVGAGYAGTEVAKRLDSKFQVTLITPLDTFVHKYSMLRAAVVPGWEETTRIPLDKLLKRGKIVRGEVKSVTSGSVTLADGSTLNADYIVLAHGAPVNGNFPAAGITASAVSAQEFKALLVKKQEAVRNAKTVIVIGAGPVGLELAGEIKAHHPTKKVIVLQRGKEILNNSYPPLYDKYIEGVHSRLKELDIIVRLNTSITSELKIENRDGFIEGTRDYTLSDGTTINADLVVSCIGGNNPPRTPIVAAEFIDEKHLIKVDANLRVIGLKNVFALGDANNVKETKQGYLATAQGELTAANIVSIDKGKAPKEYKPTLGAKDFGNMFLPIGPKRGTAAFGKTILGDFMQRLLKGKSLFVKKQFGALNQSLPKVVQ